MKKTEKLDWIVIVVCLSFLMSFSSLMVTIDMGIKHSTTYVDGSTWLNASNLNADHIIDSSVLPQTTGVYDFGSLAKIWNMIFANQLYTTSLTSIGNYIIFRSDALDNRILLSGLNGTNFSFSPGTHNTGSLGDVNHLFADIYGMNLHSGSGGAQFITKTAPLQVLSDANRTTTSGWTDLDLTASTSASAKIALILVDTWSNVVGSDNSSYVQIRANGGSGTFGWALLDKNSAAQNVYQQLIVPLDASQIFEYDIEVGTGWTVSTLISVLGYWE